MVTQPHEIEQSVSSEVAKQVVTTIMLAPDVEGYTSRGVTVTSIPVGKVAQFITSRHHVPSEAERRRTAVQLREEDKWYWTGPVENWTTVPHPNEELTMEGFTIRYMVTIFYDQNRRRRTFLQAQDQTRRCSRLDNHHG